MKFGIKLTLFLLILIWCLGIFSELIIEIFPGLIYILPLTEKTYSTVCHQEYFKLIEFREHHTMVCARCTGIYLGLLISSFFSLFIQFKKRLGVNLLLMAMVPMVLDIIFYTAGVYSYSKPTAFITGLLLGSVGFFYLYYGLLDLIHEFRTKEKIN